MKEAFIETIQSKTGCVLILAASDSDQPHVEKIIAAMKAYDIPFQVRICSAHKQPETLMSIIREINALDGAVTLIAVAGGTDALSGTLSFHALQPVISCPPDAPNESCLNNPSGSSNAFILQPKNVGRFVAQLYAPFNPSFKRKLEESIRSKVSHLAQKDREFHKKYRRQ